VIANNLIIQGLWVGPRLSTLEYIGINSFLKAGHEYHLYTLGPVANVPAGTTVLDARSVMDEYTPEQFPALASYADFFRHKLLLTKGGYWVDSDTICLKPFDFPSPYVFSSERTSGGSQCNAGIIKVPGPDSEFSRLCWEKCKRLDSTKVRWTEAGVENTTERVRDLRLGKYVKRPEVFCPIDWWGVRKLVSSKPLNVWEDTAAVHLWNEMWRKYSLDKDGSYPHTSMYEELKRKFL
jgi:hypothetical protein